MFHGLTGPHMLFESIKVCSLNPAAMSYVTQLYFETAQISFVVLT